MSGHSRWAQIKRKKAVKDGRRGNLFTKLSRELTIAARLGGGDAEGNPRLRLAISEAKANSLPAENIERAILKGTGDLEGVAYEEVSYEGYAPHGVAVFVDTLTDNKNRTVQDVRNVFDRNGGNLAANGSVAWMFKRRGYFLIERTAMDEETFMEWALAAGADDVAVDGDGFEIFTGIETYNQVREHLEGANVPLAAGELAMIPQTHVLLTAAASRPVLRLIEALEDLDDVQKVWANFELDAEALAVARS